MYNPLRIALFLPLLALSAGLARAVPSVPAAAVAIVCSVEGSATWRAAADATPEPLGPRQRLAPGTVIETAAKSTVTIVFFDGQHLALQPAARAVVGFKGLTASHGQVRRLEPIPVVVDLARLLRDGGPRRRTPAVRIRGGGSTEGAVSDLEPRDGATVRRAALTLRFNMIPKIEVYHLAVEDESGRAVLTADIHASPVLLPRKLLRPGKLYSWWVEPKVPPRPEMRGDAIFLTLDEKLEQGREALARAASRSHEPDLSVLLDEVDRRLGLKQERQP